MFKRIIWFSAGAVAGVSGLRRAERSLAERREKVAPDALINSASQAANRGATRVREALQDGRSEMERVSSELDDSHNPSKRRKRSYPRPLDR